MQLALNTLEIRILLKCNKDLLDRSYVSVLYAKYSLEERKKAINHLVEELYISPKELPLPDTTVTPVYYEITEKGRLWVKNYLSNHPKYRKKPASLSHKTTK